MANEDQQEPNAGLWIGCIMGVIGFLALIAVMLAYRAHDGNFKSFWKDRVIKWHDPGIIEMQNVHGNKFFMSGLSKPYQNMSKPTPDTDHTPQTKAWAWMHGLDTASSVHNEGTNNPCAHPAKTTPCNQSTNAWSSIATTSPTVTVSSGQQTGSSITIADTWPVNEPSPKLKRSPRASASQSYSSRKTYPPINDITALPMIRNNPDSPDSGLSFAATRKAQAGTPTIFEFNTSPSFVKQQTGESVWTDVTSSYDGGELEKPEPSARAERQERLYRQMRWKDYSPREVHQVLGYRKTNSISTEASFRTNLEAA